MPTKSLRLGGFFLLLAVAVGLVLFLGSSGSATGAPATTVPEVEKVLDHFKCWTAEGASADRPAYLQDQFDQNTAGAVTHESVVARRPEWFCNATQKKAFDPGTGTVHTAGINNLNDHLTCYKLEPLEQFAKWIVNVTNQFGDQRLQVIQPRDLCVPTQKRFVDDIRPEIGGGAPTNLDHFKCYTVDGQPVVKVVQLQDQFDRLVGPNNFETVTQLQPYLLCNPVRKTVFTGYVNPLAASKAVRWNVTPIQHPEAHLVCYKIQPQELLPHSLVLQNQFGPQFVATNLSDLLCVPSLKQVIIPPEPTPTPTCTPIFTHC